MYLWQYSFIIPPDENAAIFAGDFFAFSKTVIVSRVFPETLVATINVLESISILDITKKNISSENLTESNYSLKLAEFVKEIPCLYYPAGLQSAAIRFKNSLQENAKMHVIAEDVIESCHNGIVAWKKNSDVYPILIKGQDDYIKTKERWSILEEFFDKKGIKYFSINSVNGNILSKIMNLVYIFDYATVYFSILNSIDPSPVDAIDYIKSRL